MDIEHPDITSAIRTGYPGGRKAITGDRCFRCKEVIDDSYVEIGNRLYCENCIKYDMGIDEVLALFDIVLDFKEGYRC